MYFPLYFSVLLKLLRRLYTGGSIFKVPPMYNYSTYYCTEEFPMYFFGFTVLFLIYFSFVFYGSIEATTEAIHRWFHFSSTASV